MHINYRPEIDGLRAIAVTIVILYHAQITILGYKPFGGGFVGVDIFFVISGYLITSIILKEIASTNSFIIKNFYQRRIRRLLPALCFVMLVSLPFSWYFFLPDDFLDFSKSILYSIGFSSNFYFNFTGQQYAAENSLLKPFLHTWSLSVEEQFYILFPFFLIFVHKYFRNYLIHILVAGLFVSLLIAEWGSKNYPSFNFYGLPTRCWELLSGSILAYYENISKKRVHSKFFENIFPIIGIILVSSSILTFNDDMRHPSFYTLKPIIGVCLIIWFCKQDSLVTKLLSNKLFVGIGLISYSLYLWHYPIFAFSRLTGFTEGSVLNKIFITLILISVSIVTYYFVEKPARNKKYRFKKIFSLITFSLLVIIFFNFSVIKNEGYRNRLPEIFNITSEEVGFRDVTQNGRECHGRKDFFCEFFTKNKKNIYLMGDSHTDVLLKPMILNQKIKEKYKIIHMSISGNPSISKATLTNKKTKKIKEHEDYMKNRLKKIQEDGNGIIVYSSRLPLYLSGEYFHNSNSWQYEFKDGVDDFKSKFISHFEYLSKNNKVILVYPIPELYENPNRRLYLEWLKNRDKFLINNQNYNNTSYQDYLIRTKLSFELLNEIKGKNIFRVYPHKLFCDTIIKNRCIAHDKNNIYYHDNNHTSFKGTKLINDKILKIIENLN
jgi:peptidoglycan/LPS O-acetylase OafA/YrhL